MIYAPQINTISSNELVDYIVTTWNANSFVKCRPDEAFIQDSFTLFNKILV